MKKLIVLFVMLSLFLYTPATAQGDSFYDPATYSDVYDSGMYKVGSTIEQGEYRIISNDNYGMYIISSDANQQDVIEVSQVLTHSYVALKDGDYLKLEGVFAVPADEVDPIEIENNNIRDGLYSVGTDIPEGEYEIVQDGDYAMFIIYGSLDKNDVVNVGQITNNAFLEVSNGQYLQIEGASITDDKLITNNENKSKVTSDSEATTKKEYTKGELLVYMEEENGQEFTDEELKEIMMKYNRNVLNAMFFKDIGVAEYIHDKETFELTFTSDQFKSTLNAYIVGMDIDPVTWTGTKEVFESISGTITKDMGTNYTLSVIRPNSDDVVLIYSEGKLLENNMDSGDKYMDPVTY